MDRATSLFEERSLPRIVSLAATLLVIFGLVAFTLTMSPWATAHGYLAVLAGFALLVASLAGSLAVRVNLPRITGFLIVGLVAGPSVLGILSDSALGELHLIDEFALALIAMLAGGELKIKALMPRAKAIAWTTLAVTVVVWIGFGAAVIAVKPLLPFMADASWPATAAVAGLLGIWGANSSPDLTVAVIEETGSKGPLTDVILGTTIVKDVVVIVLFTLALSLAGPLVDASGEAFSWHVAVELLREVGGALVIGTILGWLFSVYLGAEGDRPPIAVVLFAYLMVVLAHELHVELLLTAVAAGFVIENLSEAGDQLIRAIESVSVIIFAFFFVVAGASLDLGALAQFWLAALLLMIARAGFTYLGAGLGTKLAGSNRRIRKRTWQGLVSQGGVTLGLILLIEDALPSVGAGIVALGMSIIIGNILVGPILLKAALTSEAGEDDEADKDDETEEASEGATAGASA